MHTMTAKQKRDMKKCVDQHVRTAIEKYGVPPECYGLNPNDLQSDDDLITTTQSSGGIGVDILPKSPVYDEIVSTGRRTLAETMAAMHATKSFARAVPTEAGDGRSGEICRDETVSPQDPDCLPWRKPSVRLRYVRNRVQEMLKQKMYVIPGLSGMDYDRALLEPGYYHAGEDKRFLYNPMRYQIVRIEHKLVIETMWLVPDKTIYMYLYVTSKPKQLV